MQDYTDPTKAFGAISAFDPNIIFMDLNMPGLSGVAFLDKMREEKLPNRVVVITSSTSSFDQDKISEFPNVMRFLSKPVTKDVLRSCIEVQPD